MIIHPRPVFCFYFFLRFSSKSLNNFRFEKKSDRIGWCWIFLVFFSGGVRVDRAAPERRWRHSTNQRLDRNVNPKNNGFFNFFVLFISARKIFKWPRFGSHVTREARADSPHISNIGQRKIPSGNLAISDPQNVTHFTIF